MNLVYGPISSLRYGSTLGVNLLGPEKVCSYNCGYCNLGPSTMTMNKVRKELNFPKLEDISEAFRAYIRQSVATDAIVVSGNGEPTLFPEFDDAMKMLVELRNAHLPGVNIVVLSNGAHLDNKRVIAGLNMIDQRVIKVDAGHDNLLQKINDPLVRIQVSKVLNGTKKLKDCVVQSLFLKGTVDNTATELIDDWIEVIGMIKPLSVQICTLHRPTPMDKSLQPADEDTLYSIAFRLKKRTGVEAKVFTTATT